MKITCKYCEYLRTGKNYKTLDEIKCSMINDKVLPNSTACARYKLAEIFWCFKKHNRMYTETCLHRHANKYEGCIRCRQGKLIKRLKEHTNEI